MKNAANIINFITKVSTFAVTRENVEHAKTINLQADAIVKDLFELDMLSLGEMLQLASNGLNERINAVKPSWGYTIDSLHPSLIK